jgi:transcription elongation factor/antiterminator RfaH
MGFEWYTLHSKPNKEALLYEQLQLLEVKCYYPRLKVKPVNPRSRKIRPYFPGYLFINVDLEQTGPSTLNWMPFASGLVSFDGSPMVVSEDVINSLRQRIGDIVDAQDELYRDLKPGDKVLIHSGPLQGYEAIFDVRLSGKERVQLLLKLLNGQQVRIQVDANAIQKPREK